MFYSISWLSVFFWAIVMFWFWALRYSKMLFWDLRIKNSGVDFWKKLPLPMRAYFGSHFFLLLVMSLINNILLIKIWAFNFSEIFFTNLWIFWWFMLPIIVWQLIREHKKIEMVLMMLWNYWISILLNWLVFYIIAI
jgi:hypothetical protein